jgi:SAM-dependent methyltransferase
MDITNNVRVVKGYLKKENARMLRALGDRRDQRARNADGPRIWQSPPLPVPEGTSISSIDRIFRSWSVNEQPPGHMDPYVDDSLGRFLHTWGLVRADSGKCLELGANPYFTTYLLEHHTRLRLSLANFYRDKGETLETVSYVPSLGGDRVQVDHKSTMFNVEDDAFPFDTDSFDLVLFCEMIEHLTMNPLAALREIHRVLKPGGVLVLTTPNVSRLGNVYAMINGANIYDPYSGHGPYGRHNREYNRHELHRLLEFAGYEVEVSFTADAHPQDMSLWPRNTGVDELIEFRLGDLGQYIFLRARASTPPASGLPAFLFRSWPPSEIVDFW